MGVTAQPDVEDQGVLTSSRAARVRSQRNEVIRRQEFAKLRALRQNAMHGVSTQPSSLLDEAAQSVLGQPKRTAQTLRKIDAIEAQMSGQWWRTGLASATTPAMRQHSDIATRTQRAGLDILPQDAVAAAASPDIPQAAPFNRVISPGIAVEVAAVDALSFSWASHPDVEEAAILFAVGDLDGARERLLEQLQQALQYFPSDTDKLQALWYAALDQCRATGDASTFEALAIDYAAYFGRSAPQWISMPEQLRMPPMRGMAQPPECGKQLQWSSPAVFTVSSAAALRAAQERAQPPSRISWAGLREIEGAALEPLLDLLQEWADSAAGVVFSGATSLLRAVEQQMIASDASFRMQGWMLRMALLRWMGRMPAYEQAALDYSIAYEVSPPSWLEALNPGVVQEAGVANVLPQYDVEQLSAVAQESGAVPDGVDRSQGLAGVIEGDLQEWLDLLGQRARPGQILEVSCENLIRLDFVAANCVLHWAAQLHSQGVSLRFIRLHQLMVSLFHVMGIHEHAAVQTIGA